MSEKLGRFNPDVPMKEEEKWDFSDVEFQEETKKEDLKPINIGSPTEVKKPAPSSEQKIDWHYRETSKEEKLAKQNTILGTAAAAVAGVGVGAFGVVGASAAAPITLAAIGGAAAYGALKKKEIDVRNKQSELQRWQEANWQEEFEKQRKEAEKDRKK